MTWDLFILPKPWLELNRTHIAPKCFTPRLRRSDVVVAHLSADRAVSWEKLAATLPELQRTFPGQSIALYTEACDTCRLLHLHRLARHYAIGAVIFGGAPDPGLLRTQLTDSAGLARDAAFWLLHVGAAAPRIIHDLEWLIESGRRGANLRTACSMNGMSQRTLEEKFSKFTALTPGSLIRLGRDLPLVLELQKRDELTAEKAAWQVSLSPETMKSRLRRTFGVTPTALQKGLGIAPPMADWLSLRNARARA